MEVSYSSFRVKTETDSLLLGRWEKWKSRGSCGISKRSGKVLPLDFSAERLFPPPFYPRIVLETPKLKGRWDHADDCVMPPVQRQSLTYGTRRRTQSIPP